jgi:phosphopantetheinyl transferase
LLDTLAVPEARQLEWLGARTAAKEAVAELIRAAGGADLLPAEIEILPDAHGRPVVEAPPGVDGLVPIVSLAHTRGETVALAALVADGATPAIGIDVELASARPAGFAQAALTDTERRALDGIPEPDLDEWLVRCWCAKEAVGKASGNGVLAGPDVPRVASIDFEAKQVLVDLGDRRIVVHTSREEALLVATTIGEEGTVRG